MTIKTHRVLISTRNRHGSAGNYEMVVAYPATAPAPTVRAVAVEHEGNWRSDAEAEYLRIEIEGQGPHHVYTWGHSGPAVKRTIEFGEELEAWVGLEAGVGPVERAASACQRLREERLPDAVRHLQWCLHDERLERSLGVAVFGFMNPTRRTEVLKAVARRLGLSQAKAEMRPRQAAYVMAKAVGWRPKGPSPRIIGDLAVAPGWEVKTYSLHALKAELTKAA